MGRVVFAFGYEPINVAKGILVMDWFMGAEMSTANAINLSFVRIIVFLTGAITPALERDYSYTMSFAAGSMVCIFTLIATCFLARY